MDKVREIALKTLYKIEQNNAYSNIALDEAIKNNKKKIDGRDIGFISELVYGVTTWKLTLDEIIKKYSKMPIKKISPWIINIIRMGAYQIIFLDKIPKSAAVNESVNLAKRYGNKGSTGFTNAVLRKISKKDYEDLFYIEDSLSRISKTTSMPEWIVSKLLKQQDEKTVEEICKNSNLRPNLTIRVNTLKITEDELIRKIIDDKECDIEIEKTEQENFLNIKNIKNLENQKLFSKGFYTVQDLSAGLVAKVLNPREGEMVLDCCSAPGGKTTHIAELMNNNGYIEAWDIHEHRTKLVEKTSKRLGINMIRTKVKDATKFDINLVEKFDKVLLDVPCLGLGVIKHKPDIKWQRRKGDIEEISKLQSSILETCSKYLKKGGELVYSTCSILKEENEKIIEKFLSNNKNFKISNYTNIRNYNQIKKYIGQNGYITIDTNENYDGFFICKLKRI